MALCPVHGDGNPSLSVKYDPSDGKVVMHCFGCNAHIADITSALGLGVSDLFDAPLPDNPRARPSKDRRPPRQALPTRLTRDESAPKSPDLSGAKWDKVKVYDYADSSGTVQQRVNREETHINGERHKRFTQSFRGKAGRWVTRKPENFTPLLYNLPAVITAATAGRDVWLLEGEKDVDNAVNEGLAATTNAGGANTFSTTLIEYFRGAHVRMVVDNDLAGYQRAVSLLTQLSAAEIPVTAYLPAPTARKADFTDHLDEGHPLDALIEISLADATALANQADASKRIDTITVARREAEAQLDAKDQDRSTAEQHAEAWARAAGDRFDRVASLMPTADTEYSSQRGKDAAFELRDLIVASAKIAAETYEIAGLPIPQAVADAANASREKKPTTVKFGEPGEEPKAPDTDGSGDDGGVIALRPEMNEEENPHIIGTEYGVVNGITVRIQRELVAPDTWKKKYFRIMGGWAEVVSESVEDDGTDSEIARSAHSVTVKFFRPYLTSRNKLLRGDDGEVVVDEATVKFSDEQIRDGSWARALPWPDFLESYTRNNITAAWSAIYRARPTIKTRSTVYTTLGWRETDDGPMFVHSGGSICAEGTRSVDVDPAGPYEPFKLPTPTTSVDDLKAAWREGTLELKKAGLLPRVLAPLLGHSWGALLEPNDMIVHVVGGRASFKSAHTRVALQYFAPGLHFRGAKEVLSGANMGATTIGLLRALGAASHIPVMIDDFAPDGNAKRAQEKLNQIARARFNGSPRITGKQRGGIASDKRINVNIITTGELTGSGSADTRILNLPLDPRTVTNGRSLFAHLESRGPRTARAVLGASLIQWIAANRTQLLAEIENDRDEDSTKTDWASDEYWEERLAKLPHDAGVLGRLINASIDLDRGISLMLRMLRDYGAITRDEATDFYRWAREGIFESVSLQESSAGDPAESLLRYLREAIAARKVYISDENGNAPSNAAAYGWVYQGTPEYGQWRPSGERIGVIKGDRLYLLPTQSIATANLMATKADETFSETPVSIGSALVAHGWVIRNRQGEAASPRRFAGQQVRVWDIPLFEFLSPDTDEEPGDSPDSNDLPPTLFDDGGSAGTQPEPYSDEPLPFDMPPAEEDEQTLTPPAPTPAEPAPAPAVAKPAARTSGSFRASLAVLDVDGLWLPDGEHVELNEPIRHIGQLAKIAAQLKLGTQINTGANKLRKTERGQIYITEGAAINIGIPFDKLPPSHSFRYREKLNEATAGHPFAAEAIAAGYNVTGRGSLDASVECWHDENRDLGVLVSFIPAQHFSFQDTINDGTPDPVTLARRLQKFTDALRFPYRKTASTTGLDLMFALHPKDERNTLFAPMHMPQALRDAGFREQDFDWQRPLTQNEQTDTWVHAFDRGGSYLAAVAGLDLPIGEPTFYPDGVTFNKDTRLPGYWKITIPESGHRLLPDLIVPAGRTRNDLVGTTQWVTTPTMEIAEQLDLELTVHEAYLWHQKSRILSTWQERARIARDTLDTADDDDQAARNLLKFVYVASLGLMDSDENRGGMLGFSPLRYHLIIAKSRANIVRRALQIGTDTDRWPAAIVKDSIVYTSDTSDAVDAWPGKPEHFSRGLGMYKYEGSAPLTAHLQYFTGEGGYRGKADLEELI